MRRAVELEPQEPRWHVHLGQGLSAAKRYEHAEKSFAAAAKLSGDHSAVVMEWGHTVLKASRPAEASQIYARVIQKNPNNRTAWRAAYDALIAAGDTVKALFVYEKAHPAEGRSDAAVAQLADLNMTLGRYDEAQSLNDSLLAKNAGNPDAGLRAANLLRYRGDEEAARALQETYWRENKSHAGLAAALLHSGNGASYDEAKRIAMDGALPHDDRRGCAFALCAYADEYKERGEAWEWAVLANSLYAEPISANGIDALRVQLDKAIATYQLVPSREGGDAASSTLVYIIGPPRSGGHALQDYLSRHSGARLVGARAELLSSLSQLLNNPEDISERVEALAKTDMAAIIRTSGMAEYYIDKTPQSFLFAGLLKRVHIGAKLVAPYRDMADMAVSLYFHDFGNTFAFMRSLQGIKDYLDFHDAALARWREVGVKITAHNHDRFIQDRNARGAALCEALGMRSEDMAEPPAQGSAARKSGRGHKSGQGRKYESHLAAAEFSA